MYEGIDPVHEAHAILNELKKYDEALYEKPRWLVLNKVDLLENRDEKIEAFLNAFGKDTRYFIISAINGEGCKELTYAIMEYLDEVAAQEAANAPPSASKATAEPEAEIYNPLATDTEN
jgi:GTP-binding protein